MDIKINITNKIAELAEQARIVCGNSDYTAVFTFDEEWEQYNTKTARFMHGGKFTDVVFTGNRCPMPVMRNVTGVYIGVYAGDLHTSTPAYISCDKSILCNAGAPAEPTADVYAQIMEKINDGTIKGEQGERGEKGEKGDAGVIKFIPVTELPTENIEAGAMYLVPIADGAEENRFTEYAYIDGKWETLGAISVQVDHSEYVKFTQMNEALDGKVAKIENEKSIVYAINHKGEESFYRVASALASNTLAVRGSNGALAVGEAKSDDNAVPLAQMNEALDGKLDKDTSVTTYHAVYGKHADGRQRMHPLGHYNKADYIPVYAPAKSTNVGTTDHGNTISVAYPQQPYQAAPKKYVDDLAGDISTALAGKLDIVSDKYRIYGTDGNGEQVSYGFSAALTKLSIPYRKADCAIETGTATADNDAVPLSQVRQMIADALASAGGKMYRHFVTLNYSDYGDYGGEIGFDLQGEIISSSAEPLTGKAAPANTMLHGQYAADSTSPDGTGCSWVSAWGSVRDNGSIYLRAITAVSPYHNLFDDGYSEIFGASTNIITTDIVTEV